VAVESIAHLTNQPRKEPLEYRIVAINRVSEGLPSKDDNRYAVKKVSGKW
jgi:hypothetical protein